MSDEGFVLDTPEAIAHYQMAVHIARLKAAMAVQKHMSGRADTRTLRSARRLYGCTGSTMKKVLAELEEKYEEKYHRKYGADS